MAPGPAAAVTLLARYVALDMPPTPIADVLVSIILGEDWETKRDVAHERAEKWVKPFTARLQRTLGDCNSMGWHCDFAFNSSDDVLIQGAYFVEPLDTAEVVAEKTRRRDFAGYIEAMSALTAEQFEWVCGGILRSMGVHEPAVSRRSADEGIDFYGRLPLSDELRRAVSLPSLYTTLTVWMVGQAKHYQTTQVATPDIRELVGSVFLARSQAYATPSSLPGLEMRLCDPVFYLFFTTGRISKNGWSLMKASGVVGMDGHMLADFLADHNIARTDDAFDQGAFYEWVESCDPSNRPE